MDLLHRPWSYLQDPINEHLGSGLQTILADLSDLSTLISGRFRNLERGGSKIVLPRPLPVTLEVRTEYLEATLDLGLAKRLEISKELNV